MPRLVNAMAISATLLVLSSSALAQVAGLPDWPKPPTNEDCRSFQAAVMAFYREADEQYRACASGKISCGDAPARRGAASVKKSEIGLCFLRAGRSEASNYSMDVLRLSTNDEAVKSVTDLDGMIEYRRAQVRELTSVRDRLSQFSNLSDADKMEAVGDLTKTLNKYGNKHRYSKKVTDFALTEIVNIQKDALTALDKSLKQVTASRDDLMSRQVKLINLRSVAKQQATRSENADEINARERNGVKAELQQNSQRYWSEVRRQASENAERQRRAEQQRAFEADQRRQAAERENQEAEAMLNSVLGGVAGAIGGGGRSYGGSAPSRHYSSPPPTRTAPIVGTGGPRSCTRSPLTGSGACD